jgi:hypothetical protein
VITQRQMLAWRSAALVSLAIMAAIGSSFLMPVSKKSALPHSQMTSTEGSAAVVAQIPPARFTAQLRPTHPTE